MESMKNAKNNKVFCHDCSKEIDIEEGEIKNGHLLYYESEGRKTEDFKCSDCFQKNPSLNNYQECEVYSRVVGYIRPVQQWNEGKKREFQERKEFKI